MVKQTKTKMEMMLFSKTRTFSRRASTRTRKVRMRCKTEALKYQMSS
jgi:hypothetical protein